MLLKIANSEDHPTPQEGVGGAHKLVARFLSADSRPIELGLNAMGQSCPANSHKQFNKGKHRKMYHHVFFFFLRPPDGV